MNTQILEMLIKLLYLHENNNDDNPHLQEVYGALAKALSRAYKTQGGGPRVGHLFSCPRCGKKHHVNLNGCLHRHQDTQGQPCTFTYKVVWDPHSDAGEDF